MPLISSMPLFPLGVVFFPEEKLPLHIFEPRYKEMFNFCLESGRTFGIVLFREGEMAEVGCEARITRVLKRYEDGRMDVEVEGMRRFRIAEIHRDRAYLTADVETLDDSDARVAKNLRERLITQHLKLLELAGRVVRPTQYQSVRHVSFLIAHNAGLTLEQKLEVLKLDTENERIAFLVRHLSAFLPRVEKVESFRRKVRSNGHIRDFPPAADEGET
ncbi:LON peptidase substrate-binding domain-containing protein [Rhodocaloribacter sp.]